MGGCRCWWWGRDTQAPEGMGTRHLRATGSAPCANKCLWCLCCACAYVAMCSYISLGSDGAAASALQHGGTKLGTASPQQHQDTSVLTAKEALPPLSQMLFFAPFLEENRAISTAFPLPLPFPPLPCQQQPSQK